MSKKETKDQEKLPQDEKEAEDKEAEGKAEKVEEMSDLQQLFYHCKRSDIEGIKSVCSSGKIEDINTPDTEGTKSNPYISHNTALHYAVLSGSLECVKVIFNLEAKLDSRNKIKSTPLHIAASLGYTEIVKFLIDMAADIEAKNVIGNTPLHCAVYAGHVDTVKAILDKCDNKREALMLPVNVVQFGAVKYTAHDQMKTYLKQFFPKKNNQSNLPQNNIQNNGNQIEEEEEQQPPPKYTNNDDGKEEDDSAVDAEETTPLNTAITNEQ
eukprot:96331_1